MLVPMHSIFLSVMFMLSDREVCCGRRQAQPNRLLLFVPPFQLVAHNTPSRRVHAHGRRSCFPISPRRPYHVRAWSTLDSDEEIDSNKENKNVSKKSNAASYADCPYLMDENGRPLGVRKDTSLANLQTPHSGRKFRPTHPNFSSSKLCSRLGSILQPRKRKQTIHKAPKLKRKNLFRNNRRFTEGWYYRLTLPEYNESFVFLFSIEDAGRWVNGNKSPLTLACMQLLGPKESYLVQSDDDDSKFWGWKSVQALGCTFEWKDEFFSGNGETRESAKEIAAMSPEEWKGAVRTGFQILPFHFQGRLDGHDGTLGGVKARQGKPGIAEYDFSVRPVAGWGNYPPLSHSLLPSDETSENQSFPEKNHNRQYSTAGWLASFPVFEPHWQITMAHARASGTLNWNGTFYEFEDAPFYGEKNWGGAFPTKWYWAQCNSFDDHPDLSFTAGGGIRQLPFSFLPGKRTETLGMIGIHYEGHFYEITPWNGEMEWSVWPWGRWEFRGRCTDKKGESQFEAEIVAVTDENTHGVLLRAPTKDEGMQYFCRDSGFGRVVLSLYPIQWDPKVGDYIRSPDKKILIDGACSSQCTVEVGGGPWWDVW
eukprot:CAMPEP_0172534172 /NCGR_PEP_ID=MMETSP1067-20121228/6633_1 /TAXON_ID=265564 ORGANISM="Thalassiosira punctigera, Strain Tpunct2005C2" /NCGR_SAMPLE_ID=MMETSP1067 /ASSEMBLY_ACC=CAM_ASM_000444 /LENGTH=593 /DNA_ID=CAMNT_0013318935 /DNA_START=53 /DNA_END=1831 /DNA_ORIENTATION=+